MPLVEGVEGHKTVWTDVLQNYWRDGSCFQEINGDAGEEHAEEEKIREGAYGETDAPVPAVPAASSGTGNGAGGHKHKHFKWAPKFTGVYKSVEESEPGNDGWAVQEGQTR